MSAPHKILVDVFSLPLALYLTHLCKLFFSLFLPCAKSSLVMEPRHSGSDKPHAKAWDSDSGKVGIDCRASACMSDLEGDFVQGTLKPCNKKVQTFGGHLVGNIQVGTIRWRVQSDSGDIHTFEIPDSYYVPVLRAQKSAPSVRYVVRVWNLERMDVTAV